MSEVRKAVLDAMAKVEEHQRAWEARGWRAQRSRLSPAACLYQGIAHGLLLGAELMQQQAGSPSTDS